MAEELSASNSNNNARLELAICQPDHPNQAVFISNLNISLQDFRVKISESALILPETWVFMTRAGSLVSTDQEENIQVNTITREREDNTVLDVMIAPALTFQPRTRGTVPTPGGSPLSSFATIVAALRDIYVTSIQPNMHELIKPLMILAACAAALSFVLGLILSVCLGALGGVNRSMLVPFLRHNLCAEEIATASEMPDLYRRIYELESRMSRMRQVEVGTLVCKEDNYLSEVPENSAIYVPFRKTSFDDAPRVVFALRRVSVDDFRGMKLEDLKVNSTGFSVRCSYFGKWVDYNTEYSWIAVGK